jgi:hypothetical protein
MLSIKVNTIFNQAQLEEMKREYADQRKKKAYMAKVSDEMNRSAYHYNKSHFSTKVAVRHASMPSKPKPTTETAKQQQG